ncbi:hypothetical protein G5714_024686 [Onychostoma macrolepis]|uniref:Uncharacterized protein n=1 Tax=Onychostoma macrolepis TaxID=369639 RepID=A0A7J6BI40_9TELE|nr:hypothetical protein G5714_024686 [Onychostoma macrolepis]
MYCPPAREACLWAWRRSKSPWSLAVTVTENRTKGRWGSAHPTSETAHPTSETCFWAWRRSKKPLELSCDRYENRTKGAGVVPTPPARRVSGPGVARKSRWSLAFTVTDKQSKGRWGSAHPTSETCFWAWRRSKKPLELSCDRYREPDQGALG